MTKKTMRKNPLFILMLIFVMLTVLMLVLKNNLEARGWDVNVILAGNLILFLVALFTLHRSLKAIDHPNPHVFVRHYYAGFLIRLAVIAVAAFIYIYSKNGQVDRASLFVCLGIYAIYSIAEVSTLRQVLNKDKNA